MADVGSKGGRYRSLGRRRRRRCRPDCPYKGGIGLRLRIVGRLEFQELLSCGWRAPILAHTFVISKYYKITKKKYMHSQDEIPGEGVEESASGEREERGSRKG